MKFSILYISIASALVSSASLAGTLVTDETTFLQAITEANTDSSIEKIKFQKNSVIYLSAPVIYNGSQNITFAGNNATINGSSAGSFIVNDDLTAVTEDGTLIFNTAAAINLNKLSVINSATRGIVINIPVDAEDEDININLKKVSISNSALYGLHIDDNSDEFDDGNSGSAIGVNLTISQSSFTGNGTGAIDFDGIRVDERGDGDINAVIVTTHIDGNGGDGIELDEGGEGGVDATMINVTIDGNGFYNEEDLDDGFDIDEADNGDIEVNLFKVSASDNMDEGLDFDEAGGGDVEIKLRRVTANNNTDEGIKIDEEDAGDIEAKISKTDVFENGDDGIQLTELGEGVIESKLKKVTANDNAKYGIKMEQWVIEDEVTVAEDAGSLEIKKVTLIGNGKGDEIKLNNIDQ